MPDNRTIQTLEKDLRLFEGNIDSGVLCLGFSVSGAKIEISRHDEFYNETVEFYRKAIKNKKSTVQKLKDA